MFWEVPKESCWEDTRFLVTAPNKQEGKRVAVRHPAGGLENTPRAQHTTQLWVPCWCELGEDRSHPGFILINLQ